MLGARYPFRVPRVSSVPKLVQQVVESIRLRWPDVESEEPVNDPEALAREMERRMVNAEWEGFFWADATRTAISFFGNRLDADFPALSDFLIGQIGGNRAFTRAMFRVYIRMFDPDSDLSRRFADALEPHWKDFGLPINTLVQELRVFDLVDSPRLLAYCMDASESPFRALRQAGLDAPHGAGLPEFANREFVALQRRGIEAGDNQTFLRLLAWLAPRNENSTLEDGAEFVIDALLEPCASTEPPSKIREEVEKRLFSAYPDPELRAGPWGRCSGLSKSVMRKWLVGKRIDVFFEIVTHAVTHTSESHMWADRRGLWLDLHRRDCITEAWFAFSMAGAYKARELARQREDESLASFAINDSRSSEDRKKCLLLMQINGRWVVEGSHSFKTHVFPQGADAVTPYHKSYTCEQFRYHSGRDEPKRIPHLANWAKKVQQEVFR